MNRRISLSVIISCLIAIAPCATAGDQFANAQDLNDFPLPILRYVHPSNLTAEPDEPSHAGSPANQSFWFQWVAPADKAMSFSEYLNGDTARIGVYTGNAVNALTLVSEGSGRVYFAAQAGIRYMIAVDSPGADYVQLRDYPSGGADARSEAEVITGSPPFRIRGNNVLATAEADDPVYSMMNPPNHSVWWVWTAPYSGGLRIDCRASDVSTGISIFERPPGGAATRIYGALDSAGCPVTAGHDYLISVDAYSGPPGEISLWFDNVPTGPPPNDNIADAIDLGSDMIACDGAWMLFATSEVGLPHERVGNPSWGDPDHRTIWWKWTCPQTGDYRFSPLSGNLFAGIYVYVTDLGSPTLVAANPEPAEVLVPATAGTTYWIQMVDYRRTCPRAEINIHPSPRNPLYFTRLDRRCGYRLMGRDRHPRADPDGDGFCNELEMACGSSPHVNDPANPNLPHLIPDEAGGWKLQWNFDQDYLVLSNTVPISLLPQTASSPAGPWTTAVQLTDPVTGRRYCTLPAGTAGFGRLELSNPNWSLDP